MTQHNEDVATVEPSAAAACADTLTTDCIPFVHNLFDLLQLASAMLTELFDDNTNTVALIRPTVFLIRRVAV